MGKNHRKHELSLEQRGEIIGFRKAGWTMQQIADEVKCGVGTVARNLAKKEEFGTTEDRPRSGRPRATTETQDKHIRVATLMDRFRPSHEIAQNVFNQKTKKAICSATVRNRQVEAGLMGRTPGTSPSLQKSKGKHV